MAIPTLTSNNSGQINRVSIGVAADSGGSRQSAVVIGGATCSVYEGSPDNAGEKPVIAIDVLDSEPEDFPEGLLDSYKNVLNSPADWARKAVEEFGADMICLKFDGVHPDKGDKDADHAVRVTEELLKAVKTPLILWSSGNDEKDNQVMPKVSQAAKGENCLIGTVTEVNYKSLTAVALADGHNLIAEAPLDINIAKQVNILVSDMGFPLDRIVTFQTTGALGYGMEYVYSIQERQRLAALGGDKMMAMPVISDIGSEAWRAKETRVMPDADWGDDVARGVLWEAATSVCLLQTGSNILRMLHPQAVAKVKKYIDEIW